RDMSYALTGRSAGQLETWDHIGIFGASFAGRNPAAIPRGVDPHDPHASLDHRVRSYLAANCAHCHHPDGVTANFDASFETPLSAQNLVNGLINRPLHGADDRVVSPGNVADSILHTR